MVGVVVTHLQKAFWTCTRVLRALQLKINNHVGLHQGVTEMGRKSPNEAGVKTLGTCITNAVFQLAYTCPLAKDMLRSLAIPRQPAQQSIS